jgi:hypothetical protein
MTTNGTDDAEIKETIRRLRDDILGGDSAAESGAFRALVVMFGWERAFRLWNEEAKDQGR